MSRPLLLLVLLAFTPLEARQTASAAGMWTGTVAVGAVSSLSVVVRLSEGPPGVWDGTIDIPSQGVRGLALTDVAVIGTHVSFQIDIVAGSPTFDGRWLADRDVLTGQLSHSGTVGLVALSRGGKAAARRPRPQEPTRPYPYHEAEVTYRNTVANVTLAGTLTLPRAGRPSPAVIFLTGTGAQDRDYTVADHKMHLVLADRLVRRGVIGLRSDDRGVGDSTGTAFGATLIELAGDARAAIDYLKTRPDVDPSNIGIVGHSEGGLVAAMTAASRRDVAFLVLLGMPGLRGDVALYEQADDLGRARGIGEGERQASKDAQERYYRIIKSGADWWTMRRSLLSVSPDAPVDVFLSPWFRSLLNHDPAADLRQVSCPTLVLAGGKDLLVRASSNVPAIVTALVAGGNRQVTAKTLPQLNHFLQTSDTGLPSESGTLHETIAPVALQTVVEWITARTGQRRVQ